MSECEARKALDEAEKQGMKIYEKTVAPFKKAYRKAEALEIYNRAVAYSKKLYNKTIAQIEKEYPETTVQTEKLPE